MPSRVAECLNEKNPYMDHNRVLHSKRLKKHPRPKLMRQPATSSERDVGDRHKEQQRREIKRTHPNASLKWNGHRWNVRAKEYQVRKHQIEETYGLVALMASSGKEEATLFKLYPKVREGIFLNEISFRTGAIAVYLSKVKQYANAVDKGVMTINSLSSRLENAPDEKARIKIESELWKADAGVKSALRKMSIYGALVSASGGLGADRTYKLLKKMEKKKRR